MGRRANTMLYDAMRADGTLVVARTPNSQQARGRTYRPNGDREVARRLSRMNVVDTGTTQEYLVVRTDR